MKKIKSVPTILEFAQSLQIILTAHQRIICKLIYGLELTQEEFEIAKKFTGKIKFKKNGYIRFTGVVGRKAGKSWLMSFIAVYEVVYAINPADFEIELGESPIFALISQDVRQARRLKRYVLALLKKIPGTIADDKTDEILLSSGLILYIFPCTVSALRGPSFVGGIADEVVQWRNKDNSANPAAEVISSLEDGFSRYPQAKLLKISTPWGEDDEDVIYSDYKNRTSDDDLLVWNASSFAFNPGLGVKARAFLNDKLRKDPERYSREHLAIFSKTVSNAIPAGLVDHAVDLNARSFDRNHLFEEKYSPYFCAIDASSLIHDRFVCTIAHIESRKIAIGSEQEAEFLVQDAVLSFKPEEIENRYTVFDVIRIISLNLKDYEIDLVVGDKFAASYVSAEFARHNIYFEPDDVSTAAAFTDLIALLNSRRIVLISDGSQTRQLKQIRRILRDGAHESYEASAGNFDDEASALAHLAHVAIKKYMRAPEEITFGSNDELINTSESEIVLKEKEYSNISEFIEANRNRNEASSLFEDYDTDI